MAIAVMHDFAQRQVENDLFIGRASRRFRQDAEPRRGGVGAEHRVRPVDTGVDDRDHRALALQAFIGVVASRQL